MKLAAACYAVFGDGEYTSLASPRTKFLHLQCSTNAQNHIWGREPPFEGKQQAFLPGDPGLWQDHSWSAGCWALVY